jgi:hypothetical protein
VANLEANPTAVRELLPPSGAGTTRGDAAPIAPVWLPIVTALWMGGVATLSVRMLGGWLLTQLLARRRVHAVAEQVDATAREMARRLRLRREFAVLESAAVTVPTLVGWVKPVVLLPAAVLTGLSPLQLQAVIAHELAHIRRHDYLVNLLQTFVETLLFYHPAVWWVSSEVRAEREHCCDDLAVEVCGDRLTYVSALAELTAIERRAFALAATDGSLVARVRRILGRPADTRRELPPSWSILVLLVLIGGGAGRYEMSAAASDIAEIAQAASAVNLGMNEPEATTALAVESAEGRASEPMPEATTFEQRPATPWSPFEPAVVASEVGPPVPPVPVTPAVTPPPAPAAPTAIEPSLSTVPAVPITPAATLSPAVPSHPAPIAIVPLAPAEPRRTEQDASHRDDVHVELQQKGRDSGNFVWSNDGERLTVKWTGEFRLSGDERDIAWVEEGAQLIIADGWVFTDRVEFRGLAGGQVERTFYRSGVKRDLDANGREFIASSIQRMIRSGMFAAERVTRLLQQGGPEAVLAEVDRLQTDSSYVKRVYYSALLKQAELTTAQLSTLLDRLTSMRSDFEKGDLLRLVLTEPNVTDDQRLLVARAASKMSSDFEQRKVLSATLDVSKVSSALAGVVIDSLATVTSNHDRSLVLIEIAKKGGVTPETSSRFMTAVGTMSSSHEQRKVLAAVANMPALAGTIARDSMKVAATMSSSHDKAEVLLQVVAKDGVNDGTASSFFAAVGSLNSSHDKYRVLTALAERGQLSEAVMADYLQTAKGISSSHDRSQVLLALLKTHYPTGKNRTLFLEAAESMSSTHNQNQVLAALVRAEKR